METGNKVGKICSIWAYKFQVFGIPGITIIMEYIYIIGHDEIIQGGFASNFIQSLTPILFPPPQIHLSNYGILLTLLFCLLASIRL